MKPEDVMKEIRDENLAKVNDFQKVLSKVYLDVPLKGDKNWVTIFVYAIDNFSPYELANTSLLERRQRSRHKRVIEYLNTAIRDGCYLITEIDTKEVDTDFREIYPGEPEDSKREVAYEVHTTTKTTYYMGDPDKIRKTTCPFRVNNEPLKEGIQ